MKKTRECYIYDVITHHLKMKLTIAFLLLFLFQTNANTYSQKTKISLNERNISIESILLDKIEGSTKFKFLFETTLFDLNKKTTIKVKKIRINKVLDLIFENTNIQYEIVGKQIILTKKIITPLKHEIETSPPNIDIGEKDQERTISGTITDEDGRPLPGASILEKGTQNGTQADFDGKFSLTVSNQNVILAISYLGFMSKEVTVNTASTITVILQESTSNLDEVVVVGYGSQRKSDITGSVASLKPEEILEIPVARIDQAIQGRLAGVRIENSNAAPNASVKIRIRGANSINGGNDPLIVVDGIQGGNRINTIHPQDVASLEVLKDASATAIYGSRGANGVILITTKKGRKGDPSFSYNSFVTISTLRKKLDFLSAAEYAETVNANRVELNGSGNEIFTEAQITAFRNGGGTDWQDEIFRTGYTQNHNLSISGGNENVSYYISGNVVNQEGIILNSSYSRYSVRPNFKITLSEKIKVGVNMFLAREVDHRSGSDNGGANGADPLFSATVFAPVLPVKEADLSYSQPSGVFGPPTNNNPVALALEPVLDNFTNTASFNTNIQYDIVDGLKLTVRGGYRLVDGEDNSFFSDAPTNGGSFNSANITDSKFVGLQNSNILNYNKYFGKHNLDLTGVYEQQFQTVNSNFVGVGNILSSTNTYNNLSAANNPLIPRSSKSEQSLSSYVGRLNYSFDERYLLTVTGRYDGSSVFGKNNKRAFFPSLALGWNISKEKFFNPDGFMNSLKLRGSYGQVGNQAISPFRSLSLLQSGDFSSGVINGNSISAGVNLSPRSGNPDLKWETTTQANIGLDAALLNGKVRFTADYYSKTTEDLLQRAQLPIQTGFVNTLKNIGEVENKGFEFYLGLTLFDNKFKWDSDITFSKNKNKVNALDDDVTELLLGGAGIPGLNSSIWLEVGQPIGLFRGYQYDGVWKTSEAAEAAVFGAFPGYPKYIDQDGDNEINANDIVNIGNTQADFTYGWNNQFVYKNFNVNIFIQGVKGGSIWNLGRIRTERSSVDSDATSSVVLNRWTPQNENTDVPTFEGESNNGHLNSSRWLEDGSYIRFKNISLGYSLPSDILKTIRLKAAKIYLTGTNLITITDYTGFDPESRRSTSDTFSGLDLLSYPSQKSFTLGLDIKF